ncbi:HTH-type transcriptional regulator YjiE [Ralstonia edaphis]|uniref:HTH-type transcriptional regulator YjiE n=1 Tax=Ralstonia edaphi TaxID=3058599 RepID=A0AB72X875_9RALS|nr:LysR family transcriptional regulator [Ralstonia sp. LMG 6871]CAJ0740589.1 HTH-type transcriptional regulator YjiE [Ralstonia sp. LMG 6871]
MQIKWLEDFKELAKTRSFSRAAENRNVTHPAFGRRIKALEEWVGTALVERSEHPVTLTAAGRLFLDAAANAVDGLNDARLLLREAQLPVALKIGTGRTLARTFVPGWYETLARQRGVFPLSVTTGGTQEGVLALADGTVDLLIAYASPQADALLDPRKYDHCLLGSETLVPVSAPDKRGRPRFTLPGSAAAPLPWLAFARGLTLRQMLDSHLAAADRKAHLQPVFQADFYEAVEEMALRGFGMAWLPYRLARPHLNAGELRPAGDDAWHIHVNIRMMRVRSNQSVLLDEVWQRAVDNANANVRADLA